MQVKIIFNDIHDTWFYDGYHHVYPRKEHTTREETISAPSFIEICKEFYEKNNSLRYCNGQYYTFANQEDTDKYNAWQNGLSRAESFNLYYGDGIVD